VSVTVSFSRRTLLRDSLLADDWPLLVCDDLLLDLTDVGCLAGGDLAAIARSRGPADGLTSDAHLLTRHRHVHLHVLGDDVLAQADLARLLALRARLRQATSAPRDRHGERP
jgi:hypothetical protein